MLKIYVFLGILTLVLIGVFVSVMGARKRREAARAARAARAGPVAPAVPRSPPAANPPAEAFDPNATRIHLQASATGESSRYLNRDTEALPALGSVKLVCVGGAQKGKSFAVTAAGVTVGRDSQSDIVIVDPRVSTHHAWVGIIDGKAVLRDLGSTNGTFLNTQMDCRVSEVVLKHGDTVFFGGHGGDQYLFVVS